MWIVKGERAVRRFTHSRILAPINKAVEDTPTAIKIAKISPESIDDL